MNRFLISLFVVTACQAHAEAPVEQKRVEPQTAPPQAQPLKPRSVEAKPASAPDNAAGLTAEQVQLVDRFVAKDILALTPEQATGRFADQIELRRERESEDGFSLAGESATERLDFAYLPNEKGTFFVSVAGLGFFGSGARLPQLTNALTELLTKKLGKRRKASADSPSWTLAGRVEVVLIEHSRRQHPAERVIELRVAEPGGP